jgi:GH15 family glucan-1,4-alpha-glucosidase
MTLLIHRSRTRTRLVERSLEVIAAGQTSEGAYLACPEFPTYRYSWFRDGAFIAEAMDDWGRADSALAFHAWAVRTILANSEGARLARSETGPLPGIVLHTRYRADGTPGSEDWPNFQLDGLGTWLWAYGGHLARHGQSAGEDGRAACEVAVNYLAELWSYPNFDCWEENEDEVHPATLGAIYAGLRAAAEILGDASWSGAAKAVRSYLLTHGVREGSFVKHVRSDEVDANLLWLAVPYEVVPAVNPLARATVERVREHLLDPDGGVHRYRRDTYYGGGSWLLLTAALARNHLAAGDTDEAQRLLEWMESQATPDGFMPEQTAGHLNDPAYLAEWNERWGVSACPLLWSHASYLSLVKRMEAA